MSKKLTEQEAKEAIIKPTEGGYTRAEIATTAMAEFNAAFFAAMNGEPHEQVEIEPGFARVLLAEQPTLAVQPDAKPRPMWGWRHEYGWVWSGGDE